MIPVRFQVGVLFQIVQQGAGTGPIAEATVRAVVGKVTGAEAVEGEAFYQRVPPFIRGVADQQLIGLGAVFRVGGIQRRIEIANRPESIHMAFTKQIAAFDNLLEQLLECYALPLARTSGADPFQAARYPIGAVQ